VLVLPVVVSAVEKEVSGMGIVSVADAGGAGGAGAPLLVYINIDRVKSPEIRYLPLQISREIGCPTAGVKKLHPSTSYST